MSAAATQPEPATDRDRHLFGPGPKRILALSGGGVRGALTVAILAHIEGLLDRHHGKPVRLGDYFDLIGGTSTGALIAAALARGYRTEQIKSFYTENARLAFQPRHWQLPVLQSKFDEHGLRDQIASVIGDRELGTPDLITGFCLVTKRMDRGSAWIMSNNPRAHYWEDSAEHIGNKHFPLANLIRASTAAPHYFDPELLPILPKDLRHPDALSTTIGHSRLARAAAGIRHLTSSRRQKKLNERDFGIFIDGGLSPYNNPSLALLQLVTFKDFGIQWPTGPDRLSITSIGTGGFRPRLSFETLGMARLPKLAFYALLSMMADFEKLTTTMLEWLGDNPQPWPVNSEVGTLEHDIPSGGKLFRLHRYDVRLEKEWLEEHLGYTASPTDIEAFRRMDDPRIAGEMYALGELAAKRQVRPEDWT